MVAYGQVGSTPGLVRSVGEGSSKTGPSTRLNERLSYGNDGAVASVRSSLLSWLAIANGVAMWSSPARADLPAPRLIPELTLSKDKGVESAPEPDPWTTRKRAVSIQGGAPGSPTGAAGLSFEYAPIKYLVLGAGGGWAPDGGLRGAVMPRFRLPLNRWLAVSMGVPFALGPYQYTASQQEQCLYAGCSVAYRTTRTWPVAVWGHIEPNVEIRLNGAVALRMYGGYARVLNAQSDDCVSTLAHGCPSSIGETKWYGGLALGYAW
jgi:hypothetical protein